MNEHAFAVLHHLSDGRFHSGEDIAQALGCSRTLVWQAVHAIEADLGLTVFSVRGQGYKLAQPFAWLDVAGVRAGLSEAAAEVYTLAVAERTDSTNSQLMARAGNGGLHGLVLACELQTAGRGRLGRRWQARLGSGLTFSLLWRFERGVSELAGLSLAVGVALARALRGLGAPVRLKWPNDVLLDGSKLAGILIELSGDALGPAAVVIGIGLNVADPGEVDQPVATLRQAGVAADRNSLLAALLNELQTVLSAFDRDGFAPLRDEWCALSAHQQAPVRLSFSHGEPVDGIACGVADNGALRVETAQGMRTFHVGEVSLRERQ
ncbi:biofilm PGA synthesis protein PgaB [Chromobacterium sp. F49]|uniref:biotin--[acetyl-CoA-carboxylase] ligase n=1 Tax=Chromobacterium TaxID=535 RepID=UPI0005BBAD8D|nr:MULTISPECIES: biotin--[acetyl-CoA-carboxylase] ligase [Chromobacterium]KUM04369.1 biofilm PGA synthesis protein PgaB [Chromobacterium subtsugae]KZE87386.1 biofilm PGA synthesis protein PgaB [Chromobacterium sp. F49]OBU87325.1 biofilm PGA synthesis protein PgaB [Chromobacterium subtsugae]WSE92101.1 biotin--[acetyl-CoA-carboxylase] ligase [Chromobacterium subtsugae]WVH60475.1 biotin--[acetyl-CoA-carboxylase] ligase [Chromobacterium subtsugae]